MQQGPADGGRMEQRQEAVWDRFAQWPRWRAGALLAALALALVAAAWAPIGAGEPGEKTVGFVAALAPQAGVAARPRDADLALYDRVIARIGKGESYYRAASDEQRKANYPVRPGVAVRLPTLAYLDLMLGVPGQIAAAIVLMLGTLWAWWVRLGEEPGGAPLQRIGTALMFVGGSLGLNRNYFVLHELWAGMLLALAFALHRPGRKWGAALAVAGLALAIRELCLPFVLLMAAMALWRRDWREGAAWSGLALVFAAALALHLHFVAQQILPSDPQSPSWLALRGLPGWLSNVVLASNLRFLPHPLAGPLVLLALLGWAGWNSPAGRFGALLYAGYGLAFMIAGRANNFYWGAVIAPALFIGLCFAPRALASLWRSARGISRIAAV